MAKPKFNLEDHKSNAMRLFEMRNELQTLYCYTANKFPLRHPAVRKLWRTIDYLGGL